MQMTGIVAIIMAGLLAGYTTGEGRDFLDKGSRKVESGGYSAKEELAALEIPENMLAYWMVVNGKKPFVSAGEGCQEFYWDEYFWCCLELTPGFKVYDFGIVDLDSDGMTELVITGFPDTTWVSCTAWRWACRKTLSYPHQSRRIPRCSDCGGAFSRSTRCGHSGSAACSPMRPYLGTSC